MPSKWNDAMMKKLLYAVLATQENVTFKADAIAALIGGDTTPKAISHKVASMKQTIEELKKGTYKDDEMDSPVAASASAATATLATPTKRKTPAKSGAKATPAKKAKKEPTKPTAADDGQVKTEAVEHDQEEEQEQEQEQE